jgi:PmbA protein
VSGEATGGRARGIPLDEAAARAVELADGADDAEAWAEERSGLEVRSYKGEVEALTDAGGRGIGLRVFAGGGSGYAYGTDLSEEGLKELADAARAGAAAADPDEHGGLPEEFGATPVPGLSSPKFDDWDTAQKVEIAIAVEKAARARDGVSQVEIAVYADSRERVAIANSRGFASSYEASSAWAYASAFAGQGADLMTGLGVGMGRDPGELDAEAIGAEAGDRANALVGARQPKSRRCPVVLDSFVAASFVGIIGGMLSADAVQRGRSLFAGKLGEAVAAESVRLADDATDPEGPSGGEFDGEGSPTRRNELIEDGRLATYLYDARTARKDGRSTTGSARRGSYRAAPSVGTSNLMMAPGEASFDDLVAEAGDGLFVTDVAGLHSGVNPVSGTFSVGASGRLIKKGKLSDPVREITIASDLVGMLKAVSAVGSEARWVPFGGSVKAVPLLLAEMSVAGA